MSRPSRMLNVSTKTATIPTSLESSSADIRGNYIKCANCQKAQGAERREVPKGARGQRARGARGREVPEGARCQRALGAKERFPASLASRAVWHPAQSGIPRSLAP